MSKIISNNLYKIIKEHYPQVNELVNSLKLIGNCVKTVTKPYIIALQKITETPEFKIFLERLKLAQTIYKAQDKYWIIDNTELLNILKSSPEEAYSMTITEYYSKNNYEKISGLLEHWKQVNIVTERMSIIEDCYKAMKILDNNQIINNIVIPTLLAQITGITEDLHKLVPETDKETIKKELSNKGTTPPDGSVTTEYLWRVQSTKEVSDCYHVIFNAVMKNTKKKETFTQEELEKYNKYRNKILHGDIAFLNYGTNENLIRTWLELNVLIKVYSIYKDYRSSNSLNDLTEIK